MGRIPVIFMRNSRRWALLERLVFPYADEEVEVQEILVAFATETVRHSIGWPNREGCVDPCQCCFE